MIFIIFAFSFTHRRTGRDWRSFGAFSTFIIGLFAEMYGFPLTIYLLSGWLGSAYPALNPFSHETGHLWETLFGIQGDPHLNPLHVASDMLIAGGLVLLAAAWSILLRAQQTGTLATTGPYRFVRHPQYIGFIAIMLGFLAQWPTILTLLMFPVLIMMYVRLARREEREVRTAFGEQYASYAATESGLLPRIGGTGAPQGSKGRPTDRTDLF